MIYAAVVLVCHRLALFLKSRYGFTEDTMFEWHEKQLEKVIGKDPKRWWWLIR
jgi:hypothetical protein